MQQAAAVTVRRSEAARPGVRLVADGWQTGLAGRWWRAWVGYAAVAMQAGVK